MILINIKSNKYPDATKLMIEEGNFHFMAGIRCCLSLLDNDHNVLVKRLLVINGEDFKNILQKANSLAAFKVKIMNLMDLIECPDIPLI